MRVQSQARVRSCQIKYTQILAFHARDTLVIFHNSTHVFCENGDSNSCTTLHQGGQVLYGIPATQN